MRWEVSVWGPPKLDSPLSPVLFCSKQPVQQYMPALLGGRGISRFPRRMFLGDLVSLFSEVIPGYVTL